MHGWADQSLFFGLGMLVCLGVAFTASPKTQRAEVAPLFGVVFVLGALFARALWVVFSLGSGHDVSWSVALNPLTGGYASMGWMAAGVLVLGVVSLSDTDAGASRRRLDVLIPAGALGLAVARLGCLVRGCDFGRLAAHAPIQVVYQQKSPAFDVFVALDPVRTSTPALHPFALYLSAYTLCCVFVCWRMTTAGTGRRAIAVAFGYVFGRLILEWWRHPFLSPYLGPFSIHQVILLLGLVFLGVLVYRFGEFQSDLEERNAQIIADDV